MQWPKQRTWGWYATLIRTPWFCLKLLRFRANGALSMQRHKYRTEIWILMNVMGILEGIKNEIIEHIVFFKFWGLVRIRPNEWHRLRAFNKPIYIIELQYGKKVTESDIERK